MAQPRWHIDRTNSGYHVRLVAANGENLLTSEVLSRNEDAERVVDIVEDMYGGHTGTDVVFTDRRTVRGSGS